MARAQLYGRKDKRLNKVKVKTSYSKHLFLWKCVGVISIISNIYFILDKLL